MISKFALFNARSKIKKKKVGLSFCKRTPRHIDNHSNPSTINPCSYNILILFMRHFDLLDHQSRRQMEMEQNKHFKLVRRVIT